MIFVVSYEEIKMPLDLCGTVYSRNSLAQKGILALNAGHIDPGFKGPITIKLINLRSVDYTVELGQPIFTIVFHTLDNVDTFIKPFEITREETLRRIYEATDISLNNALYDLALLREFIKENEFGRAFKKWMFKSIWAILVFIVNAILVLIGAAYTLAKLFELLKKLNWI